MVTIAHTATSSDALDHLHRAFPEAGLLLTTVEALGATEVRNLPHALVADGTTLDPSEINRLARLKGRHPWFGVLVFLPPGEALGRTAYLLGVARVDEILILSAEDQPNRLRSGLTQAALRTVAATFEWAAHPLATVLARPNLDRVVSRIGEVKRPGDLARVLGVSQAQVATALRDTSLPPTSTTLAWCRLLVGIRRVADGDATIESIALELGYSSRPAFDNTSHSLTGLPPSEILRRGGLAYCGEKLREATALRRAGASKW